MIRIAPAAGTSTATVVVEQSAGSRACEHDDLGQRIGNRTGRRANDGTLHGARRLTGSGVDDSRRERLCRSERIEAAAGAGKRRVSDVDTQHQSGWIMRVANVDCFAVRSEGGEITAGID